MKRNRLKRKSFSSPVQLDHLHMLILERWEEVWLVAAARQTSGQEALMTELKLVPDNFVLLPIAA
jgi:hypothetical protein